VSVPVQARYVIPVPAPVEGTLEIVEVEPGTDVHQGQLLGRISNTMLTSDRDLAVQELDQAQTRLNNLESSLIAARLEASRASADAMRARSEYDRTQKAAERQEFLFKERATAKLTMERAVAEFEAAKKDYEALAAVANQARERVNAITQDIDVARKTVAEKSTALEDVQTALQAAEIRSPVDGVLLSVKTKVGEPVNTTMDDLFRIGVDLHELQVTVEPEPPILSRLKPGLAAIVQVVDYSRDAIDAEIGSIENGKALINFVSPSPTIRPGMAAVVKIQLP
jgi:multidrug resistance efflux pump